MHRRDLVIQLLGVMSRFGGLCKPTLVLGLLIQAPVGLGSSGEGWCETGVALCGGVEQRNRSFQAADILVLLQISNTADIVLISVGVSRVVGDRRDRGAASATILRSPSATRAFTESRRPLALTKSALALRRGGCVYKAA
jgi:hypothetical protein